METFLSILDMNEDSPEQYGWLLSTIREHRACCPADLAFQLRGEVEYETWTDAVATVSGYVQDKAVQAWNPEKEALDMFDWKYNAKPIHWIVAALIAKAKGDNENVS